MRVSEVMTPNVHIVRPDQTVQAVAQLMCDADIGALPVGENDRLIGVITDRDIAVRAIARGRGPDCPAREAMTTDVLYCFEEDEIEDIAMNMGDQQVRRLPVLNDDKRLVGVISLADMAAVRAHKPVGEALEQIARPGGSHSQTDGAAR